MSNTHYEGSKRVIYVVEFKREVKFFDRKSSGEFTDRLKHAGVKCKRVKRYVSPAEYRGIRADFKERTKHAQMRVVKL